MSWLRISLRPFRTELLAMLGLTVLVAVGAFVVAARLWAFDLPPVCLAYDTSAAICRGRAPDIEAYRMIAQSFTGLVIEGAAAVPVLMGLVLGIAIVAKELDQRTAVFAWSMGPSRRRWLLQRIAPVAVLVAAVGLGAEPVIDFMRRLAEPGTTASGPRMDYVALSGPALALLGLAALGIALAIGAMLGRVLPALLVSGVFAVLAIGLVATVNQRFVYEHTLLAEAASVTQGQWVSQQYRTASGDVIGWSQAYEQYGDPMTGEIQGDLVELIEYAPTEIFPWVAADYLLLELIVVAGTLTVAFAVVDRRAP